MHQRMERIIAGDNRSYPEEAMSLQDGVSQFMKVTYDRRSFKGPLTPESMYRISEIISFEILYFFLYYVAQIIKQGILIKHYLMNFIPLLKTYKKEIYQMPTN